MITRLGLNGFGTRLTGSFTGKPASGTPTHPVDKITRLTLSGYMGKRVGSFAGKTPDAGTGPHPVSKITRLNLNGFMARRVGSFAGRAEAIAIPLVGGKKRRVQRYVYLVDKKNQIRRDDDEVMEIIQMILKSDLI